MSDIPRKKSPRAPTIALDEALDRALRAYEQDRLHSTPTDVFAQNIGYKSANNGAALSVLASLRYFGLVERQGDGMLAVAKNVETYKYAPNDALKRTVLLSFLRSPPLFEELLDRYDAGLPSDGNIRYELIQRGFAPSAAEVVLVAFRRSVEFARAYESDTSPRTLDPVVSLSSPPSPSSTAPSSIGTKEGGVVPDEEFDRIPVRLPGARRAWLLIPTVFLESDKNRLKAQIDLLLTEDDEN